MNPLPVLLAAMTAAAVPAGGADFSRSGALDWSYEEMSVRTPGGTRRVASWNQAYDLSLYGPLGHELIGEGGESASFQQGHTLSQLAASANSKDEVVGYTLAWSLLPQRLRRYVRINPAMTHTRSMMAWGQPAQPRSLVDTMRSLDLNLSAPSFPALDVKRSIYGRKDESGAPIIDQRTAEGSEEATYVRGPLYARYRHDRSLTDDRLAPGGNVLGNQTNGELNLSFYQLKHGFDNAYFRTSYQEKDAGLAASVRSRHEAANETGSLTTQRWRAGHWTSFIYAAETFSRDLAGNASMEQGSLSLSSLRTTAKGRINNSLRYSRGGGLSEAEGVSDSLFLDQRLSRALYHIDGSGGWTWSRGAGTLLNDSILQRMTFPVRPGQSVYVEQGTTGSTPLSGQPGGTRSNSAGVGAAARYDPLLTFSSRYSAARSVDLASGIHGVRHSLTNDAHFNPYPGLTGSLIYNSSWNQGPAGAPARLQYLTGEVDYVEGGMTLSGGCSSNIVASYDAFASGGYGIGKTTLQLRGERKGLGGPMPYWLWSVRLRREI